MRSATVCIAFVLTCTSGSFVAGMRYIDPLPGSNGDIGNKRVDLASEPSCDELRAMWRYTKRQNRAAKTNSGYPTYSYNPNIWPSAAGFPDRTKFSGGYTRARHAGRPRSRAAGGAPIYGKMVHKVPASSRWRNGMRVPVRMGSKAFEDLTRAYGTVTRFRAQPNRFRVGGGISPSKSQIPQAGSFEALKNLIQAERARELKKQHMVEEMDTEIAAYRNGKEVTDEEQEPSRDIPRRYISNLREMTPKVNYDYNQRRYIPRVGQAWSREPISPEYMSP